MVVLRLTVHGAVQPQNSPHGWERKTGTHTCFGKLSDLSNPKP
jgi:hypothetical protein